MIDAKTALLQALLDGESYGLELAQRVMERTMGKVKLGQGTLYPALRALERDGLTQSREGELLPERGGRPRIYYELTAEGLRAAREEAEAIRGLLGVPQPVGG